ncbi:hypothetical protein [Microbacterium aurantiacum]|uniref:hypothetical protein n=1 Tax=Microbacterium aurantiacum TaxID=162393 RepID=UPI0034285D66
MRCPICDQPKVMYLPATDAPNIGLYSCECGFEIEGPAENIVRAARPTRSPLSRPTPISLAPVGPLATSSPYRR